MVAVEQFRLSQRGTGCFPDLAGNGDTRDFHTGLPLSPCVSVTFGGDHEGFQDGGRIIADER